MFFHKSKRIQYPNIGDLFMDRLIEFQNVSKTFYDKKKSTEVFKDLSFDINKGEIVSILGPSGCGKSTILNLISGLEEPNQGKIVKNCELGYMFQKDNLLSWRNVLDNILLALEVQKKKTPENLSYINSLLQKYGLIDFIKYYPSELSGGMKQRVALIRTLSLKPDLLLLDEPFSALDAQTRLYVQDDVYKIIKEEKKSALIVTHDISEAISLSNRIIILGKRPCTIKKIIKIDFKQELSPIERRNNSKFNSYFSKIYEEIHHYVKD